MDLPAFSFLWPFQAVFGFGVFSMLPLWDGLDRRVLNALNVSTIPAVSPCSIYVSDKRVTRDIFMLVILMLVHRLPFDRSKNCSLCMPNSIAVERKRMVG